MNSSSATGPCGSVNWAPRPTDPRTVRPLWRRALACTPSNSEGGGGPKHQEVPATTKSPDSHLCAAVRIQNSDLRNRRRHRRLEAGQCRQSAFSASGSAQVLGRSPGALLALAEGSDHGVITMGLALPGRTNDCAGDPIPELAHLTGICVLPPEQGAGVGGQTLDYLIEERKATGCARGHTLDSHREPAVATLLGIARLPANRTAKHRRSGQPASPLRSESRHRR